MSGNDFTIVGVATSGATIRSLDRGRAHQALFEVSTGEDTIPCQMTRSDPKGLRRLTDGIEAGRLVVVTGVLDTRVADVGALRVPILIPFVQHLQLGDSLRGATGLAELPRDLRPPIAFSRFRIEGMVATEPRPCRMGRAHGCQVAVRNQHHTAGVLVLAGSAEVLARRTHGIVVGAEVDAVGYLRMRTAGAGLTFLEAVSFSVRVRRGVVRVRRGVVLGTGVSEDEPMLLHAVSGVSAGLAEVQLPKTVVGSTYPETGALA